MKVCLGRTKMDKGDCPGKSPYVSQKVRAESLKEVPMAAEGPEAPGTGLLVFCEISTYYVVLVAMVLKERAGVRLGEEVASPSAPV